MSAISASFRGLSQQSHLLRGWSFTENYTLLRFPDRNVRFINAGHGGDTAEGGFRRLDKDVFDHGATLLIVAYGINDIGWGTLADAAHKQTYLKSVQGIVNACKEKEVRVYICSAAVTERRSQFQRKQFSPKNV
jgi:lysophospholipase L1-like esterase